MWVLAPLALAAPLCAGPPVATATVQDPSLDEISGVSVGADGLLWVIEDSGNPPVLTALDRTGATRRTVRLRGFPNHDWEDLAAGPCADGGPGCLYVADIGDNVQERPGVAIARLREPTADGRVTAEVVRYRYPDGPQNAEALTVAADGRIFVYTKRPDDTTRVYEVPASFGADTEARLLGTLPVDLAGESGKATRITGASLVPGASATLLLRSYASVWSFPADIASPTGWSAAGRARLPAADEVQGEAIGWDAGKGGYWQVSEAGDAAVPPSLWFTACTP